MYPLSVMHNCKNATFLWGGGYHIKSSSKIDFT
jgi:hypothetical protein